ncbi:MAG: acyl-CoA dehydratase activase-related protein [Desulfobacterales bacterium]
MRTESDRPLGEGHTHIFEDYGTAEAPSGMTKNRGRIGITKSFMVNTYFPLYANFFSQLGFEPVLPKTPSKIGIDRRNSAFCYPGELAHGFFHTLVSIDPPPEYIFLPYFKALPTEIHNFSSQVCPIVQGETFYLQTTFKKELDLLKQKGTRLLAPILDMTFGEEDVKNVFIGVARQMGMNEPVASRAFETALEKQRRCTESMREQGRQMLDFLARNPDKIGVVLFCRSYNGFPQEAHMGIPHKLASRGVPVIPWDFLDASSEESKHHMYWGVGQRLMKAARLVQRHPRLFGVFITNFSCGPDSFLVGYFRDIMGRKPSLTLELDSHTADAGLETRIEAFLDIVAAYCQIGTSRQALTKIVDFTPAALVSQNGATAFRSSSGKLYPLTHPNITLLIPSMGKLSTEAFTAVFKGSGYRSFSHPPADEAILKLGRANTSCKECLPLILTTGSLLNYIRNIKREDELLVYFMPTTQGPCRFGQYSVFMNDLIRKLKIPDTALFSLTSENTYAGLGNTFERRAWWAVIVSDVMEDIRSMLLANAVDPEDAMSVFDSSWDTVKQVLEKGDFWYLLTQLERVSGRLRHIRLKQPVEEVPVIALIGEIFVRRDGISRQFITERLAKKGFAVHCAPVAEWLYYLDALALKGLSCETFSLNQKLGIFTKNRIKALFESRIKSKLELSGLVHHRLVDVKTVMANGGRYISPTLGGETILTVGSALTEVAAHACGVISIGPFGCMPTRLSEAILTETMNKTIKLSLNGNDKSLNAILADMDDLPFLSIESDGSPFPQVLNAKLEAFCIRAERLHDRMLKNGRAHVDGKRKFHVV